MDRNTLRSFKFVLVVIAVIWIFYFAGMVALAEAVSLTLGAMAGGFIGWLTVRWLMRKYNK